MHSLLTTPLLVAVVYVVSCSAQDNYLVYTTGYQPILPTNTALKPYLLQGFNTTTTTVCSMKFYNTPPGKAAGQRDLKKVQRKFVQSFNKEYGTTLTTNSGGQQPVILAVTTEATDQLVRKYESSVRRRLATFTYIQIIVKGTLACKRCGTDNKNKAPSALASQSSNNNSNNNYKNKTFTKKDRSISEKILSAVVDREIFAAVDCLTITCNGALLDSTSLCDKYLV